MSVLPDQLNVVNVGLPMFADALRAQGVAVQHVDWRIPAGGDATAVAMLSRLYGDEGSAVDAANQEVVRRLDSGLPQLVGVSTVAQAMPEVTDRTLLHPGPPIEFDQVCDPLRRSMRAAVVAEGWATEVAEAQQLLARGDVALEPANHHQTVVPMASAIGPSSPVFVMVDDVGGTCSYAPISEGHSDVAWLGRDTDAAIERLRFIRDIAGPALAQILSSAGSLDILHLVALGISMSDDVHIRTQAATNELFRSWLPQLAELPERHRYAMACFLSDNHLFFLTLAMAAAKTLTLWAEQVSGSSIVTSMSRNGTTFGIKLAGSPQWYVTHALPVVDALYFPGYGLVDSALDIGDSAVLELVGLGGPAAAGSPAVTAFLGGSMADARRTTEAYRQICVGTSSRFILPPLEFTGTPIGIDVRRVVELGITPQITTGILHASSGVGQVGVGAATAPLACFTEALTALAARVDR
ncbi:MAG TPA: DUF1116 domain-containing protein [Pseudonocardiaceae bacterium]|nr:DUF1116 domain-containing protein [Pseudonocardiaceae bacterium]